MDKKLVEKNKTELKDDDVIYGIKEPNRSCKYCHGTGRVSWNENGNPVLCRCLKRKSKADWITVKEFRSMSKNKPIK